MQQQAAKIGVLLSAILVAMIALTVFSDSLLSNVTNPVSQVFTGRVTQQPTVTSDLTLTLTGGIHWFTNTTELTVTGSTTGLLTPTATVTLDATRSVVTIAVLTGASTTEDVTVSYLTEDSGSQGTVGWKLVPLFLILITMAAIGGAIFVGFASGSQGNITGLLVAIGLLFVGVILGEVVKTFTDDAITLYALQPDYTGVGSLLPIVDLGYVFAVFGIAIGGVIGFARKQFG